MSVQTLNVNIKNLKMKRKKNKFPIKKLTMYENTVEIY